MSGGRKTVNLKPIHFPNAWAFSLAYQNKISHAVYAWIYHAYFSGLSYKKLATIIINSFLYLFSPIPKNLHSSMHSSDEDRREKGKTEEKNEISHSAKIHRLKHSKNNTTQFCWNVEKIKKNKKSASNLGNYS